MGATKNKELDFLRKPEPDELDFLRTPEPDKLDFLRAAESEGVDFLPPPAEELVPLLSPGAREAIDFVRPEEQIGLTIDESEKRSFWQRVLFGSLSDDPVEQSFWNYLIHGSEHSVQAETPPELMRMLAQVDPESHVFNPLYPYTREEAFPMAHQRQVAADAIVVAQLVDTPRRVASNIMYTIASKIRRFDKAGKPIPIDIEALVSGESEDELWVSIGKAAKDGASGEEYARLSEQLKMIAAPSGLTLRLYNLYLNQNRALRYADKTGSLVTDLSSDIIFDVVFWGGVGKGVLKIPGVKGIFNDVPDHVLRKGLQASIRHKSKQYNLYANILQLDGATGRVAGRRAALTWADDANDIMNTLGEDYGIRTVHGIWPQVPSADAMIDVAKQYGVEFQTVKRLSAPAKHIAEFDPITKEIIKSTIHMRTDVSKLSSIVLPGGDVTNAGRVFLHELGHALYWKIPKADRVALGVRFRSMRFKVKRHINDLVEGSPEYTSLFPTKYSLTDPQEFFAETFMLLNSNNATRVPLATMQIYIPAIQSLDVPIVDIIDVKKTILAKQYIETMTTRRSVDKPAFVNKTQLNQLIEGVNHGKIKSLDELSPKQLQAMAADIQTAEMAPESFKFLTDASMSYGGIPHWRVWDMMGMPHAYNIIDDAMHNISIKDMAAKDWENLVKKQFKKEFGIKWEDGSIYSDIMSRFADEGPEAVLEGAKDIDPDIITFIKQAAEADRELFFVPRAKEGVAAGLLGKGLDVDGLPAVQDYYFHRRNLVGFMNERAARSAADEESLLGVLPSDYRIERALSRKIPKGVNAPEFIARTAKDLKEDVFSRDYWPVRRLSIRETDRKLYLEPAATQLDSILDLMQGSARKEAKEYAHKWMRGVRGMPSPWDEKLNRTNRKLWGKAYEKVFKRPMTNRSFERLSQNLRRLSFGGTIAANPRSIIKQETQNLLSVATIGNRATLAGWDSMFHEGGKRLLNHYKVRLGGRRLALAQFDITSRRGYERLLSIGFTSGDYVNVAGAGNGAMWYLVNNYKSNLDRIADFAARRSVRGKLTSMNFWDVVADAADEGIIDDLIELANRNIKTTQFSYNQWDMPVNSAFGKLLFQFTNWPSHYFGAFIPQMWRQSPRFIGGKAINVFGQRATYRQQLAPLTYLFKTLGIVALGKKYNMNMSYLLLTGPVPAGRIRGREIPFPITPATALADALGSMILGAMQTVAGEETSLFKEGIKAIPRASLPYIPAGTTLERVRRVTAPKFLGDILGAEPAPVEYIFLPIVLERQARKEGALKPLKGIGTGLKPLE